MASSVFRLACGLGGSGDHDTSPIRGASRSSWGSTMSRDLKGKRAILTGASGGIGRATAAALVKAGVRLVLAARNADALHQVANDLCAADGEAVVVPTDITKPDDR